MGEETVRPVILGSATRALEESVRPGSEVSIPILLATLFPYL